MMNQAPLSIGSPAASQSGTEYNLSLLKLFLSEPVLVDANGHESKAQLVGADGKPLPYGIQLVDADDLATQLLHVAAAQGSDVALLFGVGVPAACNAVSSASAVYPLNPDSEMFWTWGSQYLFVRIEGSLRTPPSAQWSTFFHHVGYDQAFAKVSVAGAITVGASGVGPTLSLDVDRMLGSNGSEMPSGKHDVPDGFVSDNLENNQAFTLK
jgi:hypothetical protein